MMSAPAGLADQAVTGGYGPWHPGLESELPRELLPLATVFRPENVSTSVTEAFELSDYCGMRPHELVAFRPERLIVHELLVHVTAGLSVPDGHDYEDLGRNFREIASTVLTKDIAPRLADLKRAFEEVRSAASVVIARELCDLFPPRRPDQTSKVRWPFGFAARKRDSPIRETAEQRERRIVLAWSNKAQAAGGGLEQSCLRALSTIATAITARRGRLLATKELLADLAVRLVCNDFGSEAIGDALAPLVEQAALREGYLPLSPQQRPVIMNVKGASAAGKSSMRPLQRVLAGRLGFPWESFALISPDIWRKFLLDYGSLGAAYKYAGTMTGHEIEIIDKKLDRHMAMKAARGEMPHMLIDRFRFDSFIEGKEPTRLLTRFGDLVYMFFLITPPEMTVERAWKRGLQVGRYKALEDLLAHNVEAYAGMPELFFIWALNARRRVHYEFLDNSVAEGRPLTVAFGWNGEMTILDLKRMLDIDRFRKINIYAQKPAELYAEKELAPERNTQFLQRCARLIPTINLADRATGRVYARLEHGKWTMRDEQRISRLLADPDARAAIMAIHASVQDAAAAMTAGDADLEIDHSHNLGSVTSDQ